MTASAASPAGTGVDRLVERARDLRPELLVVAHPYGAYRFERPRADRIDPELGVALRLIEPALFRPDAPPTDRPALPVLVPGRAPTRSERIVIGYLRREDRPDEARLVERAVRAATGGRDDVEWRPDGEGSVDVFVDHLDSQFGGYTPAGLEALARGAAVLGAALAVGPHVEAFWPRPPVLVVEDADALTRRLGALLDDRDALFATRLASWRWARDVAAEEPASRRLAGWLDEAVARISSVPAPPPIWTAHASPRIAAAVIACTPDRLAQASLRAALRSVSTVTEACVVVLDDRSLPDTVAMLEALGARVVRRAWTRDFAAARNAVHGHTDAPWLLWIDSDEVLVDAGDLERAIAQAEREGHQGVLARVETVGDDGPGEALRQIRVYHRPSCRWRYAIHNELDGPRSVVPSSATFHASYVGTTAAKIARSLPMLLEQAAADPDEPRWAHLLAQTYHVMGDTDAMSRWAERCIATDPDERAFIHRWCDLALARFATAPGEGLRTILDAVRRHPTHPDGWHALATMALARWYETSGAIDGELTPVRTARYHVELPAAARRLGLPLSYVARRETKVAVAEVAPMPIDPVPSPRPPGRLRIAFIEQLGLTNGRFLDGIVAAVGARAQVRHVETAKLAEAAEAAEWADVVWLEWGHELTAFATQRVRALKDKPVVCRIHGFEVFTDVPEKADWSVVDHVIFVAQHKRAILLERLPVLAEKSSVIRNGVALGRFTIPEGKLNTRHLAAIGHLNYRKGYPVLLQHFHELARRDGRFRLSIRGDRQDARYEMALRTMIDELELGERVAIVTEWVPDLDAWLADKSHVVSCSLEESFHCGLGDGIAAGLRPVIHAWREAREIWPPEHVFRNLDEFLALCLDETWDPAAHRHLLVDRGLDQARQVREVVALLERVSGARLDGSAACT